MALYRDRADSENAFDELKNQWGWGSYTTQDLKRSRFTAMMTALVYNGWSLFVRLANPETRLEAIISMHGKGELAKAMLTCVSRLLHEWKSIAAQLTSTFVCQRVCQHITNAVTGFNWLAPSQTRRLPCVQTG